MSVGLAELDRLQHRELLVHGGGDHLLPGGPFENAAQATDLNVNVRPGP